MADEPAPPLYVLEAGKRLSESQLWTLQREFYRRSGTATWTSGDPWYITGNPFVARAYARMVVAFLRDCAARPGGTILDRSHPVPIVEVAAGAGVFGFHFLRQLLALLPLVPELAGVGILYVLTDLADANVAAWQENERFAPFVEQGRLDFARFDLETEGEIRLLRSGTLLAPGTLGNPLVAVANYAFGSALQDVFFVRSGALHEGLVTLASTQEEPDLGDAGLMERLRLSYESGPVREASYGDPALDAVLREYGQRLGDSSLLIPIGAVRCLRTLLQLAHGPLLALVGDKGHGRMDEIVHVPLPEQSRPASPFSMEVNLHALGLYMQNMGGAALQSQQMDRRFKVAALLGGGPAEAFPETRLLFREAVESFTPFDFHRLNNFARRGMAEAPLEFTLALLKLAEWDPHILQFYGRAIGSQVGEASEGLKLEVRRALERAWEGYFPMGLDLAFEIGHIYSAMQLHLDALRFYKESLRITGAHPVTLYNAGLSLYLLGQPEEALRFIDHSLRLKPDYGLARDWRNRIEAELGGP